MSLGSSLVGNIGNNLFATLGVDLGVLLGLHGVLVQVTRHNTQGQSNIYGEPLDNPTPFTVTVLLAKEELKEEETPAGGKRNEVLTFIGQPGTLLENDIVAYSGHNYDVRHVGKTTVQSAIAAEVYIAMREVDI